MIGTGITGLMAGLVLAWPRMLKCSGASRILILGPVFEAVALAVFAAEHFLAARDLMSIVPRWLAGPLFWTYFVGAAWLAAAISLITWKFVRWSSALVALLFLIIVATIDMPNVPMHVQERLFWTLTARESAFAGGAMVLAGSLWPRGRTGGALMWLGRGIVAATLLFYGFQHFLFPRFAPGVPLMKLTPAWAPLPVVLAYVVGLVLVIAGVGLLIPQTTRMAAAWAGIILLLLTAFLYLPILVMEIGSPSAVEGINYVGDTLLFAATVLLAGFGMDGGRRPSGAEF